MDPVARNAYFGINAISFAFSPAIVPLAVPIREHWTVAEYDATTGTLINPNFIPGLYNADGLAVYGKNLFAVWGLGTATGAALHLDQGIAVTSHASQAKTVDQVIASVPVRSFSQANEAQFYVTMSRARWAMHVFTDSKVALRDAVIRPSKRLSSWELLNLAKQSRTLKAELARQGVEPKKQQQEVAYER
jgi:hypothetical protein